MGHGSRQKRKSHTAETKNTKILVAKNSHKRIGSNRAKGWGVVAVSGVCLENPNSQQEKTEMGNGLVLRQFLADLEERKSHTADGKTLSDYDV